AIVEFQPANAAYRLTPRQGFRTFLKVNSGSNNFFYEPFQDDPNNNDSTNVQKMRITSHDLTLEETNPATGLAVEVMYCTLPGAQVAGLIRKLTLTNISGNDMKIQLLDGLPAIIPYYLTNEDIKTQSNLRQAWMGVSNYNSIPFYKISVLPDDKPETSFVTGGYYYMNFCFSSEKLELNRVIVDPSLLFGHRADFSYPELFTQNDFAIPSKQIDVGITPCGFGYHESVLPAGGKATVYTLAGKADSYEQVTNFYSNTLSEKYLQTKIEENRILIEQLKGHILTVSSAENFDLYCGQSMLDNILRGGCPIELGEGKHSYYVYSRKHGDLEREYNFFQVDSSYYSQGNAAFRDVNQNRRNDVVFFPFITDSNIKTFMNLIQPDGFNPLTVKGSNFRIDSQQALILAKEYFDEKHKLIVSDFLQKPFTPGSLLSFLEQNEIQLKNNHEFLDKAISLAKKEDIADFQDGYWSDHWTYNNDLLERFLSVYPDKAEELLYNKKEYTYYDNTEAVLPRHRKYVLTDNGVRQYGAVQPSSEKQQMIKTRTESPFIVRTNNGKGEIYQTTLIAKLFTLICNKIASLDAAGTGIEMEADKPGWCDAMNGLPGILGSSINESAELGRLAKILLDWPGKQKTIKVHEELYNFYIEIKCLMEKHITGYDYWDQATTAKEIYREKVFMGFSGNEQEIGTEEWAGFLRMVIAYINNGLKQAMNTETGVHYTYFINEVKEFKELSTRNKNGLPYVKALSFEQRPIAYFLEGPMHVMRTMKDGHKELYQAIKQTGLYDKKLDMYRVNDYVMDETKEIGRINIFPRGWLENESVFLHMEYKYFLELLKAGLYNEFFHYFRNSMVPFLDPATYGRSILENSSFIAASGHPDKRVHGRGYVSRLTGASAEFLHIWLVMTCGERPFTLDKNGELQLEFKPALPEWLFTETEKTIDFVDKSGNLRELKIEQNCFAFCFLGKTMCIYLNKNRKNTFGHDAAVIRNIDLYKNKEVFKIKGGVIPAFLACQVRDGAFDKIEITLE
ncbi:MAG: hypothetical protein FWC97_07660, partial [Treponema sp.]|nr:hypothetical protein [Treponema sp.]